MSKVKHKWVFSMFTLTSIASYRNLKNEFFQENAACVYTKYIEEYKESTVS